MQIISHLYKYVFIGAGRFSGKQQLRCSAVLKPVLGGIKINKYFIFIIYCTVANSKLCIEYANVLQMGLPVIKLDDIAVEELLDQALKVRCFATDKSLFHFFKFKSNEVLMMGSILKFFNRKRS